MITTRLLPELDMSLAESPLWDDRAARFYWVDINAGTLHGCDVDGAGHEAWDFGEKISALGLMGEGALLMVAGVSGLWCFDPVEGEKVLQIPFPDLPTIQRPNDGKVGPDGAFWVGTMEDRDDRGPEGRLYRFTASNVVQVKLGGLTTPNGIAWSPDGRWMYLAETRALTIHRFSFDAKTGSIGSGEVFATLAEGEGKPDGAMVAADGSYWVAGIYSGKILGFRPDGTRLGAIEVSPEMVTMPCLGGVGLDQLLVTSLARGDVRGGIWAIETNLVGQPSHRFGSLD
ncbi:SMP-30/gluconolactonase/LRE family protein [Phaeobacter gallaeciensis]|uniref:SMP-30/gluconolactonase/LRE family protein n=1 Tax=Phaeobacter gallaeciensis TaxID=60890 RepID=UPI00237F1A04|nr:SMP-30/gluconolactonase/LRE family protein [Phaeobacter gallaeciensis]MDE4193113.1 SMP-30/gluconolactonase/LRE family protein [Phaeobacter gallaeciensis]MDE4201446.1 SMP-30/gluconolactonase/LRE family protein [Phaeobacter gallaeciensis]MDE4205626.1 SMP-30/gluconolactonase/LRE family protein [Phaeobacter gallaeciensis]MDE4209742.1 SMP-30/gluconolactonase/LRE family protein [Phaeobacter gallaeciensis]MDE4218158.1 SMP-30/gluconolactonase/LRE family protein [Phaeobacter gallaeciensis]